MPLKEDMILHLGHWMQFIPAKIETINPIPDSRKPQVTFALEKELTHLSGDNAVVTYLEGGKLRIVGTINLP